MKKSSMLAAMLGMASAGVLNLANFGYGFKYGSRSPYQRQMRTGSSHTTGNPRPAFLGEHVDCLYCQGKNSKSCKVCHGLNTNSRKQRRAFFNAQKESANNTQA